jgi:ABC-type transporter Mla maintaining outer membrane lipid asymmetry permease subunit MlaE
MASLVSAIHIVATDETGPAYAAATAGANQYAGAVKSGAAAAGAASESAGHIMTRNAHEARAALAMLGEETGVRLPRHVRSWLSSVEGIAPIMAAAFTPIMVIGLIESLGKVPEAMQKGIDKLMDWGEASKKRFEEEVAMSVKFIKTIGDEKEAMESIAAIGLVGAAKKKAESGDLEKQIADVDASIKRAGKVKEEATATMETLLGTWGAGNWVTEGGIFSHKEYEQAKKQLEEYGKLEEEQLAKRAKLTQKRAEVNKTYAVAEGADNEKLRADALEQEKKISLERLTQEDQITNRLFETNQISEAERTRLLELSEQMRFDVEKRYADQTNEQRKKDVAAGIAKPSLGIDTGELEMQSQKRLAEIRNKGQSEHAAMIEADALATIHAAETVVSAQASNEERMANVALERHKITINQETAALTAAETKQYTAKKESLENQLRVAGEHSEKNKAAITKLNADLELLEVTHKNKLNEIDAEGAKKQEEQVEHIFTISSEARVAAAKSEADMQRMVINAAYDAGNISLAERVKRLKEVEEAEYRVALMSVYQEAGAAVGDPVKTAQAEKKIQEITAAHNMAMEKINIDGAKKSEKPWDQYINSLESNFNRALNGLISGHMKTRQVIQQFWQGMVMDSAQALERMIEKQVLMEAKKLLVHTAAKEGEVAVDATAAAQSTTISAMSMMKQLAHFAATAAAGAYSAIAGIPYVGPVLAPIAAAAALAGVYKLATMEEGGLSPRTQLTMIHAGESVYTEKQTTRIEKAMSGNTSNSNVNNHYHGYPGESPNSVTRNTAAWQRAHRDGRLRFA